MMKSAVDCGIFRGIKVGSNNVIISHLQYADDVLIMGEWDGENWSNLMAMLRWFQLSSGLQINMNKSYIHGFGVDQQTVTEMTSRLGCKLGEFPFTYLGLPVGGSMRRCSDWGPVIEKFKRRLSDWRVKSLSQGGRLTLVKSVLGGLSLYYFSIFRAPLKVINTLEGLRRNFFWGNDGTKGKPGWIKWENVSKPYRKGGLNIGSLKSQNWSLLGKWWWRFKMEPNFLWTKVISSIFGMNAGLDSTNHCVVSYSSTWSSIIRLGSDLDKVNLGWESSFRKSLGDGRSTSFWSDKWAGDILLKNKFPRLFHLDTQPCSTVFDKGLFVNGVWSWCWNWCRALRGRAKDDEHELDSFLSAFSPKIEGGDSWSWSLDDSGIFTVKRLRYLIEELTLSPEEESESTLWNNLLPKKICAFIWRARADRIPVRLHLDRLGLDLDSVLCPWCQSDGESIDHCFLNCVFVKPIWNMIFNWWGWSPFNSTSVKSLMEHSGHFSLNSSSCLVWQAVVWAAGYLIWWNRNCKVFGKKFHSPLHLFGLIQIRSFSWLSSRWNKGVWVWSDWISNPVKLSAGLGVKPFSC